MDLFGFGFEFEVVNEFVMEVVVFCFYVVDIESKDVFYMY